MARYPAATGGADWSGSVIVRLGRVGKRPPELSPTCHTGNCATDNEQQTIGNPMTLSNPTAILRIFDEAKAREFYIDFLEFTVDWEHRFEPETPIYMQISKDGVAFHLSEHHGDSTPGSAVRVHVVGLQEYQEKLAAKQYKYYRPGIQKMPWGTRDMSVQDPFGNKVIFWEE